MTKGLLTTAVGSYPKPKYITKARSQLKKGLIDPKELKELEQKATAYWIETQEALDMDILVDGEMYRGDMVTYFSENMEGFDISGLVRSYGNRYYRKPIATGPVGRKASITLDWWKFSQSLTKRPMKGMLTGPYTMADWSFNEYYPTFAEFVMAMAKVVNEEAKELEKAGARYIQIDEPAVSTRTDEMDLAIEAMAVATEGLTAYTFTHICYGDFAAVIDKLSEMPVDNIDLEVANGNYGLLEIFRKAKNKFSKGLSMGVTDVHNHTIETMEEVKNGIKKGLELFPPEKLFIDPDCGLKTRTEEESINKLKVIAAAVKETKKELGIE